KHRPTEDLGLRQRQLTGRSVVMLRGLYRFRAIQPVYDLVGNVLIQKGTPIDCRRRKIRD
ncbi:MAG: hypothetical protein OXD45_15470, partial [Rhodobacteraceae bacterium]|nr:hypothetical protein [Paracoccaceae bacterium]